MNESNRPGRAAPAFRCRVLLVPAFAALTWLLPAPAAADNPAAAAPADSKVLVVVGNQNLTLEDLLLFMFQEQGNPMPQEVPVIPYMLDRLLVKKILVNAALQANLTITDAEIQKFIDTHQEQYQKNGQLFSDAALRSYIRDDMLNDRMIRKHHDDIIEQNHIAISDQDLKNEFVKRATAGAYTEPERARFQYILLAEKDEAGKPKKGFDKALAEVAKAVQADPDFASVARKYTDNRSSDGKVGFDTAEALPRPVLSGRGFPDEILDEVFKMNSGDPPKQLKLTNATVFLKVVEKVPRRDREYSEVKDDLRAELIEAKVQPLMKQWFDDLKKSIGVDFKVPMLKEMVESSPDQESVPTAPAPADTPAPKN